ncbi:MAG: hypothetical protein JXR10_05735 [Cyclobacteriaceae bacterium]
MAKGYNNWEQFYHRFNTIFHGIIALSLLPFAFVFLETQRDYPDGPLVEAEWILPMEILLGLISLGAAFYAWRFQKNLQSAVSNDLTIKERLGGYLKLKLRQYAILEVASLSALIGLFLTKEQFFSGVYVVVLFVFSIGRPTYDLVVRELRFSKEEEAKLKSGEFE